MMKKIILLLGLIGMFCSMQAQTIHVRLDTIRAVPGDSVIVPIYVENFTGVGSLTFVINFTTTAGYTNSTFGRILNWNPQLSGGVNIANGIHGKVSIIWAKASGASIPDGKFADLKFFYNDDYDVSMSFASTCEITDIYGNTISPAPVYSSGLIKRKLEVNAMATPPVICQGGICTLNTTSVGGIGNISYYWTSDPPGFFSLQLQPVVQPTQTTTYHLMATDGHDTAYTSSTVTVYSFVFPSTVSNMLPADSSTGLSMPLLFNWVPAANAAYYDFYLWKVGDAVPSTPTAANLIHYDYLVNSGLIFGETYRWRIVSRNPCLSTAGPVQHFTLRHLPDLVVQQVKVPATAFSGKNINVTWQVKNISQGGTLSTSWKDYIYLSTDSTLETSVDYFAGAFTNVTSLNPGQSYQQNVSFTLPQGISGYYYLFVWSNQGKTLNEINFNNNVSHNVDTLLIGLSPSADLRVVYVLAPNSTFSAQTIPIKFKVQNFGGAITNTALWIDRVYLSEDSLLQPSAMLMGTYYHSGLLAADSSYVYNANLTLPPNIFGRYYLFVSTDVYNNVYEHATDNNNTGRSDSLRIFLTPPPDLVPTALIIKDSVSNNQTISVSWSVQNQGATVAKNGWYDYLYLSNALNLNTSTATYLGWGYHYGNLSPDSSYTNSIYITIPKNISGPYYLYVFSDVSNNVYEYNNEGNNIKRTNKAIQILSPDLQVHTIQVQDTAFSGAIIPIDISVKNNGPGTLFGAWSDQVFVSKNSVFVEDSSYKVIYTPHPFQAFMPNDSLKYTLNAKVPDGLAGDFYVYVKADANNIVFEGSNENNNVSRSDGKLHFKLSPYPDFVITNIMLQYDTAYAGLPLRIKYTVKNTGNGPIPLQNWTDSIAIADNPFNNYPQWFVKKIGINLSLQPDSSYTIDTLLITPYWIGNQFYYINLFIDCRNNVYEYLGENNNASINTPIYLRPYPSIDLKLNSLIVPDSAKSGSPIPVQWTVTNQSVVPTVYPFWYDALYLSSDTLWNHDLPDGNDIEIGRLRHYTNLPPGANYSANMNMTIPSGLSGTYYLIMVTDRYNYSSDANFVNNIGFRRDASNHPVPVHIQLDPPPDLVLTSLECPGIALSGQPFTVKWTVKNQGVGPTTGNSWIDKVLLSHDFVNDPNDLLIGTSLHIGTLPPGQSFQDSLLVTIPVNYSGNYIMMLVTDATNLVYELHENNNTMGQGTFVQQSPPSDLMVSQIVAPASVTAGDTMTVSWKITNSGVNPAVGIMKDIVYLSKDSTWDVSDIIFGEVQGQISLGSGSSVQRSKSSVLTGASPGNWYVLVRTNVLSNINESNFSNNTGVSHPSLSVTVPLLVIHQPAITSLFNHRPLYYRLEIPAGLADESLLLRLKGDSISGSNELYLRFGDIPTRTEFDFAFGKPSYGNQQIIVPTLQEGTYYIMVYGNHPISIPQNINLLAEILPFGILSVEAAQGGNTGNVTLKMRGSKFTANMQFFLVKDQNKIVGQNLVFVDLSEVYVTFDLKDADTGYYDVVANEYCQGKAMLIRGFKVIPGSAPDLEVNVYQPALWTTNRSSYITIEFTNAGNFDLESPTLLFESIGKAPVALNIIDLELGLTELNITLNEPGGPPGILRPGMSGTIFVYFKSSAPLLFTFELPTY